MAGMNLSSSMVEKKPDHTSGWTGSLVIPTLFVLILMGWGGLRWYLSALDSKLSELDQTIEQSAAALRGENVDRVAYFDARLTVIENQLKNGTVDSQALLGQLERLTIPTVKLTEYVYNDAENIVTVSGETDSFRYVAQQLLSLKSEAPFSSIRVDSLKYAKNGRIAFSFKASL